jgi:hypothetical protein
MVKLLYTFGLLFVLLALPARADFSPKFKMEFSKKEIYVGEQVMCNFVIYTDAPLIDVEVAKFPEFRGYWVENLVLRQGPMATNLGLSRRESSVVVGTYLLIPIVDRAEPTIEPMRVVMRNSGTGEVAGVAPDYIASEPDPLVIKKLPANPVAADAALFSGAVGRFEIAAAETKIEFQKDEPVVLRVVIQGEGNFQEVNELPLPLPEKVEVLSKRSSTQGVGRYFNKIFEFTLAIHDPKDLQMAPIPFVYFDPNLKKYVHIETQPIFLDFKETENADTQAKAIRYAPYQTTWTIYRPLIGTRYFIVSQIILALLFAGIFAGKLTSLRNEKRKNDPKLLRRQEWEQAIFALNEEKIEFFLKAADQLVFQSLCARAKVSHTETTRAKVVEISKPTLSEDEVRAAKELFATSDAFLFSPTHPLEVDLKSLAKRLTPLVLG